MEKERRNTAASQLDAIREQLQRIQDETIRGRLLKALVLWEMDYPREAVSQFRITAERALQRLVDRAGRQGGSLAAAGKALLQRGQSSKAVEWLHRDVCLLPARMALHLHTLLGWGSFASHHQEAGHEVEVGDLAILTAIAMDLEEWVTVEVEGSPSIFHGDRAEEQIASGVSAAVAAGVPEAAARALTSLTGDALTIGPDRLKDGAWGIELFWRPPSPDPPRAVLHGLAAFEPEDAGGFVGRDRCLRQILDGFEQKRAVILSGESGAGKTSLLRAAVLPWALQHGFKALCLGEPTAQGLTAAVKVVGAWPPQQALLLIVDQLERAWFADTPSEVRQLAVELAVRAVRWSGVQLVVGIREDFLGRFWREARRVETEEARTLHQSHQLVVVDPMGIAQAREVINTLLGSGGATVAPDFLEGQLLPELCGGEGVPPVHLQIVCGALLAQTRAADSIIDESDYRALGGAPRILSAYLQRVLSAGRYAHDRPMVQAVLKCLAGEEGRRWAEHGELWQAIGRAGYRADELALINILQRLQSDRLIVSRTAGSLKSTQYSLSHEIIAPEVISWRTPGEIDRDRAQELLDQAVAHWRRDRGNEPLTGRNLKLVEAHWDRLDRSDGQLAEAVLSLARRIRATKRTAVVGLVVLALAGVVFGAVQLQSALRQKARAKQAADLGVLLSARLALQRDPSLAVAWLRHLSPGGQGLAIRSLLNDARRRGVARVLSGHRALVTSVAFSPDGKTLLSASRDKTLRLWSPQTAVQQGRTLRGHAGYITRAVFSPNGELIASSSWDKTIRLWRAATGQPVGMPLTGHEHWVYDLAFSSDGEMLASAGFDGTVRIWRVSEKKQVRRIDASAQGLLTVALSPDARLVCTAGIDGVIRVWDVADGALYHAFEGHTAGVYAIRLAHDGDTLVSAGLDSTVRVWSIAGRQAVGVLRAHTDGAIALAISDDGRRVASAGEDKLIYLWNLETRRVTGLPLRGHLGFVRALAFSPDGELLASGSQDQTIRVWNLPSRAPEPTDHRLAHGSWVQALAFAPGGQVVATGTRQGYLRLWDVGSGQPASERIKAHEEAVVDLAITDDGQWLASASRDGRLRLWRFRQAAAPLAAVQSPQAGGVHALAPGRRGVLFSGGGDGTIQRWIITTTGELQPDGDLVPAHTKAVVALREAPDGKTLASASRDRLVRLWRPRTLAPRGNALRGHTDTVYDVCFSHDSRLLASASGDGSVRLWQIDPVPHAAGELTGHQHWVMSCAFDPGSDIVAAGGSDSTIRFWSSTTARSAALPLFGHSDWVYALAYSPRGDWLASASGDKTVRLWSTGQRSIEDEIDALTNLHVSAEGKTSIRSN